MLFHWQHRRLNICTTGVHSHSALGIFWQGWVFATAKSIFARTVEKRAKTAVKSSKIWQ